MRYFLWLALYTYGLLYHISSSEFWPITISKTWFTPEFFEASMLQKPLLSFFLALFHLLPLNDVVHVFLVKTVFSVLGVAALTYFCHFVLEISRFNSKTIQKSDLAALMAFILVCCSPVIRTNYFNVRSDQLAILGFSVFLLFCERRQMWPALISLLLVPCFGIKEIVFLIPGGIYFYWSFRSTFTPKILFFTALGTATILIWVVALNMNAAFYFLETIDAADFSLRWTAAGLLSEAVILTLSVAGTLYIFATRLKMYYRICWLSSISILLMTALPQANPFFFASVMPVIMLPAFVLLFSSKVKAELKAVCVAATFFWSGGFTWYNRLPWHFSNFQQLVFIQSASKVIRENNFTYLDGQGILPRQKFLPCFTSPADETSKNGCLYLLKDVKPDALIITNRLMLLEEEPFLVAQANYTQLYPNLWIRKEKMNDSLKAKTDLSANNPLPILIFY